MATHTLRSSNLFPVTSMRLPLTVGLAALLFSILYFISDVMEFAQGGFSPGQLTLTLVAEGTIPLFVIGLHVVQRPRIGRLGLVAAITYAYTFTFFAGTVVFALVESTSDWMRSSNGWARG